jgi:glycosyltransferase involved in cell wall biosynthesis
MLSRYKAIVTHSEHMRQEYVKHGVASDRVHKITYLIDAHGEHAHALASRQRHQPWHLLFCGRMDPAKGGHTLLAALQLVRRALDLPLHLTFAGDGPERANLERKAAALHQEQPQISITFPGWLQSDELRAVMEGSDLLVMPSLWPEPFGRVGPEAGLCGVPAAAFAVGGIPEWLTDNVNGHLAPGDPPTVTGLAEAMVRCLHDPDHFAALRHAAIRQAERFDVEHHFRDLIPILTRAGGSD